MITQEENLNKDLCSRIDSYFRSPDIEMKKLGQKICHAHRISYWVVGFRRSSEFYSLFGYKCYFSLEKPVPKVTNMIGGVEEVHGNDNSWGIFLYQINLKNNGTIKAE